MTESMETKVARVEERQEALSKVVYEIKDNHLAHLAQDVKEVNDKIDKITLKIAVFTGGALVLMYILEKFVFKNL